MYISGSGKSKWVRDGCLKGAGGDCFVAARGKDGTNAASPRERLQAAEAADRWETALSERFLRQILNHLQNDSSISTGAATRRGKGTAAEQLRKGVAGQPRDRVEPKCSKAYTRILKKNLAKKNESRNDRSGGALGKRLKFAARAQTLLKSASFKRGAKKEVMLAELSTHHGKYLRNRRLKESERLKQNQINPKRTAAIHPQAPSQTNRKTNQQGAARFE